MRLISSWLVLATVITRQPVAPAHATAPRSTVPYHEILDRMGSPGSRAGPPLSRCMVTCSSPQLLAELFARSRASAQVLLLIYRPCSPVIEPWMYGPPRQTSGL